MRKQVVTFAKFLGESANKARARFEGGNEGMKVLRVCQFNKAGSREIVVEYELEESYCLKRSGGGYGVMVCHPELTFEEVVEFTRG